MIVHNISIKAFQKDSLSIKRVERRNEEGQIKGSLVMFSEWLKTNIRTNHDVDELIIKPLQKIRKIRQIPAHQFTDNSYNIEVYKEQDDLVVETYAAIRGIRLFFSNHPLAKNIKIPDQLVTGENIVCY